MWLEPLVISSDLTWTNASPVKNLQLQGFPQRWCLGASQCHFQAPQPRVAFVDAAHGEVAWPGQGTGTTGGRCGTEAETSWDTPP